MDVGSGLAEEKQLGRVVAAARKAAGLTQQGLCHKSGLSYSTLAKIERGAIRAPSVFTIHHLAATLGLSLDDLLRDVATGKKATVTPAASSGKQTSRSGVKFVFFDMNGCLVRSGGHGLTLLAQDAGVTPDVVENIFWQYNEQVNRGDMTLDELNTNLAHKLGVMVDWCRYYLDAVEATPGMAELVSWAAENYQVGILTNTMPTLVEAMLKNGTLPAVDFACIVDSSQVHALKPEPQMYDIAAQMAGVDPTQILLVDDDNPNLGAAARMGWQTISFDANRPEESIINVSTALQPAD